MYIPFYSGFNSFASRYLIVPLVSLMIATAIGIDHFQRLSKKTKIASFFILLYLFGFMSLNAYPVLASRHAFNTYEDLAQKFTEISLPGDLIIHYECTILRHYLINRTCTGLNPEIIDDYFNRGKNIFSTKNTITWLEFTPEDKEYFEKSTWTYAPILPYQYEDWRSPLISRDLIDDMLIRVEKE